MGEKRQSRSERQEVQEAARRAQDSGPQADAFAERLAQLPETERRLLVMLLALTLALSVSNGVTLTTCVASRRIRQRSGWHSCQMQSGGCW